MATRANLQKVVSGRVTIEDIDAGKGCDPNKCGIKLSVARALNVPHGYISVDATGISVTRRTDYREKAFMTKPMLRFVVLFDDYKEKLKLWKQGKLDHEPVCLAKPFSWKVTFHKTTNVYRSSTERKAQINAARNKRKAEGKRDKKYDLRSRVMGIAVSQEVIRECRKQ